MNNERKREPGESSVWKMSLAGLSEMSPTGGPETSALCSHSGDWLGACVRGEAIHREKAYPEPPSTEQGGDCRMRTVMETQVL